MPSRFSCRGLAALLLAFVASILNATPTGGIVLKYSAPGRAHVTYSFNAEPSEGWQSLKLLAATGGPQPSNIDWGQAQVAATLPLTDATNVPLQLGGWDPTTKYAGLRLVATSETDEYAISQLSLLQGGVQGTLLFNETYSGEITSIGVTVPEGLSFNLSGVTGPPGHTVLLGNVNVQGTLSVSASGPLRVGFNLYSPQSLVLPDFATVALNAGSDGSTLAGGDSNAVHVTSPGCILSGLTNLRLTEGSGQKGLTARSCTFTAFPDIALEEGASVSLTGCDFSALADGFSLSGGSSVTLSNCTGVPSLSRWATGSSSLQVTGCDFRRDPDSGTMIDGVLVEGPVSGTISGCDLGSIHLEPNVATGKHPNVDVVDCRIRGNIMMRRPLAVRITGNLITGYVGLGGLGTTSASPTISDNSFVGSGHAIASSTAVPGGGSGLPLAIGTNYYGDRQGPTLDGDGRFLHTRGTALNTMGFDTSNGQPVRLLEVATPAIRGRQYTDRRFFPEFWVAGGRPVYGQVTVPHEGQPGSLDRNLATFLSFDVVCSHEAVQGVDFFLKVYNRFEGFELVGTVLYPISQPDVVRRDSARYNAVGIVNGLHTVNFVVPPGMATLESIPFELWADTSGVTGYEGTNPGLVQLHFGADLRFGEPRQTVRPIRIEVIPVTIDMPGFPDKTPDGSAFAADMKRAILACLPLTPDQLEVRVSPPYQFTWGSAWFLARTRFMNELAGRIAMLDVFESATQNTPKPDIRVAVLASGALGPDTYGASMMLRRSVLLVDEKHPATALHEWGHYLGLNNIVEQYTSNSPNGIEIAGMTMAPANEGSRYLGADKFLHMPLPSHFASSNGLVYTDLMGTGAGQGRFWATPETLGVFRSWINGIVYNKNAEGATAGAAGEGKASVPYGKRRILVTGRTLREDDGQGGERYRFEQGSLRALDITLLAAYGGSPMPPRTTGSGDACTLLTTGDPSEPYFSTPFFVASSDGVSREGDIFSATFDVPEDATGLRITRDAEPGAPYLDIATADDITLQILKPGNDETVGNELDIEWAASSGGTGQPLQVAVILSRGAGGNYLLDVLENRTSWTIPTNILQPGDLAAVAILVSDGLRYGITNATLVVPNRAPSVRISWPPPGTRLAPGSTIDLVGGAVDMDDGDQLSFSWTSDRDRELGTEESLGDVLLSAGFHRISLTAEDTQGNAASASTTVSVHPFDELDLRMEPDALTLAGPLTDPTGATTHRLLVNEPHAARILFRNEGAPTTATLSLAMRTPTATTHQVLLEQEFVLQAHETVELSAGFTPVEPGDYLFGAWVASDTYPDPDPSNNLRLWTYSTESDPPRAVTSLRELAFSGPATERTVEVWNVGEADLALGGVAVDGANARDFAVVSAPGDGTVLASGQSAGITVAFAPRSAGEKAAVLRITTNDPANPKLPVVLNAEAVPTGGTPEAWGVN